jgi:hypothetical protein
MAERDTMITIHRKLESFDALLAAAKLAVMESADLRSETCLSPDTMTALNEAIEKAGGWTQAELDAMEASVLDLPEAGK